MTRKDFTSKLKKGVKDFSGADLHGVDFSHLYLEGLNFKDANLSDCNFWLMSLKNCNLENADLSGVKMRRGVLMKVNLTNARLDNAYFDFNRCVFEDIEIDTSTMDKHFPLVCPNNGEFIGWKKAYTGRKSEANAVIVKLLIPKDAKRSSAFGRKCRCDKAKVLSIEQLAEPYMSKSGYASSIIYRDSPYTSSIICAHSMHNPQFEYELGKEVSVDNFDEDRSHECAPGIHFFMTREEAVNY